MGDITAQLTVEVTSKGIKIANSELQKLLGTAKQVEGATKGATQAQKGFNDTLNATSGRLKVVARDITALATVPLALLSKASIDASISLNEGLSNVQSLIPTSVGRIEELKDAVMDLSIESGRSFDTINAGLYRTISVFQDGTDTVERLKVAVDASVAGFASVEDSVQLLAAVTRAYGDTSAEAVQKVSDLAFETVRLGDTTFPALASAMQVATDRAVRLGISQEELFATMATLTGITGDASMVATQFRSAMDSLLNPTDDLNKLLKDMGFASAEAAIAQEGMIGVLTAINERATATGKPLQDFITRKEGITLASRLATQQLDDFNFRLSELQDASGATALALDAVKNGINTVGEDLREANQRLEAAQATLGDKLAPALVGIVNAGAGLLDVFNALPEPLQFTVITLAGLVPLLSASLFLFASIKSLGMANIFGNIAVAMGQGGAATAALNILIGKQIVLYGLLGVGAIAAVVGITMALIEHNRRFELARQQLEKTRQEALALGKANAQLALNTRDVSDAVQQVGEVLPASLETLKNYIQTGELVGPLVDATKMTNEQLAEIRSNIMEWSGLIVEDIELGVATINARLVGLQRELDVQGTNVNPFTVGWDEQKTIEAVSGSYEALKAQLTTLIGRLPEDVGKTLPDDYISSILLGGQSLSEARVMLQNVFEDVTGLAPDIASRDSALVGVLTDISRIAGNLDPKVQEQYRLWAQLLELRGIQSDRLKEVTDAVAESTDNAVTSVTQLRTSWQEAFANISGIQLSSFAVGMEQTDAGLVFSDDDITQQIQAAEAYLDRLDQIQDVSALVGQYSGQELQLAEIYGSSRDALAKVVSELLLYNETLRDTDNEAFMLNSTLLQALIPRLEELGEKADRASFIDFETGIREASIGLDVMAIGMRTVGLEFDVAQEKVNLARTALEEVTRQFGEAAVAGKLNSVSVEEYTQKIEEARQGLVKWNAELLTGDVQVAYKNITGLSDETSFYADTLKWLAEVSGVVWSDIAKDPDKVREVLEGIDNTLASTADQLLNGAINTALQSTNELVFELGRAWVAASDGTEKANAALSNFGATLAKQLPNLLLNAGIQLLGTPAWPVGLGLITAGLAGTLGAGLAQGAIDNAEANATSSNAHGNIFSGGIHAMAQGALLNSVVSTPTLFPMANGRGLMGEAGPEAVMPLARTRTGDLGVQVAGGGGGNVEINIINQSGAEVTTQERDTPDGKVIDVLVRQIMKASVSDGTIDKPMKSRYGVRARGI